MGRNDLHPAVRLVSSAEHRRKLPTLNEQVIKRALRTAVTQLLVRCARAYDYPAENTRIQNSW